MKKFDFARMRINIGLFLILMILAGPAFAASADKQAGELSLKARVVPETVHVGDDVRFIIQAEFPPGFSIEPISPKIKVDPFELRSIDKPLVHSTKKRVLQTIIMHLTIFELGDFKIPSIPVAVWNIAGQRFETRTRPINVKVVSIGKNKTDSADIRPIKGPAAVSLRYLYDWTLGSLLAFSCILLMLSLYLRHRRRAADLESRLPPHERVYLELERLKESGWLAVAKEKEHFSGLSDILRHYFERRYGLAEIMEMTTSEMTALLKKNNFDSDLINDVRDVLQKADLVKFAKFPGDRALSDELETRIRQIAEKTKPAAAEKKS